MAEITLTSDNFKKEIKDGVVLVDFWAPWCGPCQVLGPIIEEIAEEADGYKVAKLNVDEAPEIAQEFHVMAIPTVIVFKDGEKVGDSIQGVRSKEDYLEVLNNTK